MSAQEYEQPMNVNLNSAVIAAQEAVRGFASLPSPTAGTFIYTGNKLNVMADSKVLPFGIARAGAAHMIWDGASAYRAKGYRLTSCLIRS